MKATSFIGIILVFSITLMSCKKETTAVENTPKTETTIIDSIQPVNTSTKSETVALNPPHGQPNHRCDIAVGAPLNSLPTPSSLLNQPQQTPTNNANTSPIQSNSNNNTGVKPATNPAHGQPYHRCDLKVGDPLPNS
ncbi:MAG TPA: hypothetical protein VFY09_00535 [Flavobacteriaceae bacterium]|nr:hypothetical protein [Flavobacteriaceae bacterium]HEX5742367.1 hypothetical protein [Flavobacteriaceae bacterium]